MLEACGSEAIPLIPAGHGRSQRLFAEDADARREANVWLQVPLCVTNPALSHDLGGMRASPLPGPRSPGCWKSIRFWLDESEGCDRLVIRAGNTLNDGSEETADMDRLQLATLLSWSDNATIQGRKRLQKVVFFLQEAGCDLDCRFTLHHFGPYSRDVADACDEMVAAGLVIETGGPPSGDLQYSYALKPEIRQLLTQTPNASLTPFEDLGRELIQQDLWQLELGSTILFFHRQTDDWTDALEKACDYKKARSNTENSMAALAVAQRVHSRSER